MQQGPRAALIGANGYLGRHLLQHLQQQSWHVDAFDMHDTLAPELEAPYQQLDITDAGQIKAIAWDYDYLFYFSGLTGTDISFERHEDFIRVNETGLLHLLQALSGLARKPQLVFPSTRLVYKGVQQQALSETAEKEFKTIYASSKYNGELYLKMYHNLYQQPYTVFRICVPYGNLFQSELSYGTISFFLSRARKGEAISLFGDGELRRTFTHVQDICHQISASVVLGDSVGEVYNVDGETYSLLECARMIGDKYQVGVQLVDWPQKAWLLESGDTIFDATKIRGLLASKTLNQSLSEWVYNN